MMPVFLERRADRLHGDQGPLARHRRQGAVLAPTPSTSSRRARSSRASSSTAAASSSTTSTAWRSPTRACRRWSPATSTPRSSASAPAPPALVALVERYGLETFQHVGRAHVRPRRGGRAHLLREDPRRPLRRPGRRWTPTASPTTRSRSRSSLEVEGSSARVDFSDAPDAQDGPVNCPIPSTVSASRIAITMLAGGGEAPNEGHFRPIEVVTRPGSMFHPVCPAPCFLYGWPAMQAMEVIYNAVAKAMPDAVPALQRRRHLLARLVGRRARRRASRGPTARRTRSARARTCAATGRTACCTSPSRRRRFSPDRGLGDQEPVAAGARRAAPDSGGAGKHRGGLGVAHGLPDARGRLGDRGDRAHQDAPAGAWRAASPRASRTPARCASPTARRTRLRQGHAAEGAQGRDARADLRRRRRLRPGRRARPRGRARPTSARATSPRPRAREQYPHAFETEPERRHPSPRHPRRSRSTAPWRRASRRRRARAVLRPSPRPRRPRICLLVLVVLAVFGPLSCGTRTRPRSTSARRCRRRRPRTRWAPTPAGATSSTRFNHGARLSLTVAPLRRDRRRGRSAGCSGCVAGVFGGWLDAVLMRVMDAVLAFPPLILAMAVTDRHGRRRDLGGVSGSCSPRSPGTRGCCAATRCSIRSRPFIEAAPGTGRAGARGSCAGTSLPHVVPTLLVQGASVFGYAILTLAALGLRRARRAVADAGVGRR